jgi:hypothetical protein
MIVNFTSGSDFIGVVNYANRDDRDTAARILGSQGVCTVTNQAVADSFNLQGAMRPDAPNPVRHFSISFHPDDAPKFPNNEEGDELMLRVAKDWMEAMGYANTQWLLVRHNDHAHPHAHLIVNLVDNDGKLLNTQNDLWRNVAICKRLKKKYGLTFGKRDGKRINADRLRGYALHRHEILMAAHKALESASDWRSFETLLKRDGVKLSLAISRTGVIQGVSYSKGEFRITGSKLDKTLFTYGKLAERFGTIEVAAETEASHRYDKFLDKLCADNPDINRKLLPSVWDVCPHRLGLADNPELRALRNRGGVSPTLSKGVNESFSLSEGVGETPTPSDDDSGNEFFIPVSVALDLILQPYEAQFPSLGGTDTSLDTFRKRAREQEQESKSYRKFRR